MDPGEGLDGLAETHLVCEEAVPLIVPGEVEPVDALQLVWPESVLVLEDGRLGPRLPVGLAGPGDLVPLLLGRRVDPPAELLHLERVHVSLQLPGTVFVGQGPPLDQVVFGCNLTEQI